jgi:dipeptidase E
VRLYLSSYRVGDRADVLRGPVAGARAGIVLNALDAVGATRDRSLPRETDDLERLGYRCDELDLRRYVDDLAGLTQRLQRLDRVWVVGGNAFVLARAMARAGFREALLNMADRAGFTYAGYSAVP